MKKKRPCSLLLYGSMLVLEGGRGVRWRQLGGDEQTVADSGA